MDEASLASTVGESLSHLRIRSNLQDQMLPSKNYILFLHLLLLLKERNTVSKSVRIVITFDSSNK